MYAKLKGKVFPGEPKRTKQNYAIRTEADACYMSWKYLHPILPFFGDIWVWNLYALSEENWKEFSQATFEN